MTALVTGFPFWMSGWNAKYTRKELNGKEAYYLESYYLFDLIPIVGAWILQDDFGSWRLWRECDPPGHFVVGYVLDRDDITITTHENPVNVEFSARA
jgi:hypothetical protein